MDPVGAQGRALDTGPESAAWVVNALVEPATSSGAGGEDVGVVAVVVASGPAGAPGGAACTGPRIASWVVLALVGTGSGGGSRGGGRGGGRGLLVRSTGNGLARCAEKNASSETIFPSAPRSGVSGAPGVGTAPPVPESNKIVPFGELGVKLVEHANGDAQHCLESPPACFSPHHQQTCILGHAAAQLRPWLKL